MFRNTIKKIKCNVQVRMAQGAIVLILFAFCVCLSCISSSAVGSGVFYACSDGTMTPGEFDFNKCLNFGLNDITSGTEAVTGLDVSDENEPPEPSEPSDTFGSESLVPDSPEGYNAVEADAEFLDFFERVGTERLQGQPTLVPGATTKIQCAKICYNEEKALRVDGDQCNGFVSDGFNRCLLYPSTSTVEGSTLDGRERSYVLKYNRDGGNIVEYKTMTFDTATFNDGGPWNPGKNTSTWPNCQTYKSRENDRPERDLNGLLTGFKVKAKSGHYMFRYTCLMNDGITAGDGPHGTPAHGSGQAPTTTSGHIRQGGNRYCGGKKKNHFWEDNRYGSDWNHVSQLPADCGDTFIKQLFLSADQTQHNGLMSMQTWCTDQETSDSSECKEFKETPPPGETCNISSYTKYHAKCPSNMAITKIVFGSEGADLGAISYRCCPKPDPNAQAAVSQSDRDRGLTGN